MTLVTLEKKLKPFEEPVKNPALKWLYLHLPPQPITTRKMHRAYTQAMKILLIALETESLEHSTRETIKTYLNVLTPFVQEYEKKEFPIGPVSAEDILRFLMEQNDLAQADLAKDLGGQSVVSDILRGKRKLNRDHIERLSKRFHINPATFFP
jgi:HTH-type transcriptional regulator/antitoxin HigA